MENQNNNYNITGEVLEKIKAGQIKMRPKIYFLVKSLLFGLGFLLLSLFLVYLISFILFSLRVTGIWFLPGFGLFGIKTLIGGLPWALILLCLAMLGGLELFAEKASFVYRKPAAYSLSGIIVVVLVVSFFVSFTPLHPQIFRQAEQSHMPMVNSFYGEFAKPGINNVYRGVASEITDIGFNLETPGGRIFEARPAIGIIFEKDFLAEGDNIILIGERSASVINFKLFKKVSDDFEMFPRRGMHRMLLPAPVK